MDGAGCPKDGKFSPTGELRKFSPDGWWRYSLLACNWKRPILDACPEIEKLGRIHIVESRLTAGQRKAYMADLTGYGDDCAWRLVHAGPEDKIHALAQALRAEGADHAR